MHSSKYSLSKSIILDFIFWGAILSVVLNMYDNDGYHKYQVGLVAFFCIFYGPNSIVNEFVTFVRRYVWMAVVFGIWVLQAYFNGTSFFNGGLRMLSIYLIIFIGYYIAKRKSESYIQSSVNRLWILLWGATSYGLFAHFTKNNPLMYCSERFVKYAQPFTRMTSAFVHPIPCATFVLLFVIFTLTSNRNIGIKVVSLFVGMAGLIFTFTRSAWLVCLITICVLYFPQIKTLLQKAKIRKKTAWTTLSLLIVGIVIVPLFSERLSDIMFLINNRLFSEALSEDMSFLWRASSIRILLQESFRRGPVSILFGNGFSSAARLLQGMTFGSAFSYNVATADNTYFSILFDFGVVGIVLFVIWFRQLLYLLHRCKTGTYKSIVMATLALMLMGIFYEEFYWCNIGFLVFVFIGIILGGAELKKRESKMGDNFNGKEKITNN